MHDQDVLSRISRSRRFFVYLLMPAIFQGGWRKTEWPSEFHGATLVGAAVRKAMFISGWERDKASGGVPRPGKRVVPQGSVYFFEAGQDWDNSAFETMYQQYNFNTSLSDEYAAAGFGTCLLGAW